MPELDSQGPGKPLFDQIIAEELARDAAEFGQATALFGPTTEDEADSRSRHPAGHVHSNQTHQPGGLSREDFVFGSGSFVGTIMRNPEYFDRPAEERAKMLGWVAGCPVPEELLEARDAKALEERYGQVAFWFGYAVDKIEAQNPGLAATLRATVPRDPREPLGKHEPQSIPESYKTEIAPLAALTGYTLSRLFIEQAAIGKGLPRQEASERLQSAEKSLRHAAVDSQDITELVVRFARNIQGQGDIDTTTILKNLLPAGWLEENNGKSAIEVTKGWMDLVAPYFYRVYEAMTEAERKELKIA